MTNTHLLTKRILIALTLGAITGFILHFFSDTAPYLDTWLTEGLFKVLGQWFISGLMLIVVPLVFVSLVKGMMALEDASQLGKISFLTISLYAVTTMIAITTGLLVAHWLAPGQGMMLTMTSSAPSSSPPDLISLMTSLIPKNFFAAMTEGNMLQIIIFSIFFGLSLSLVKQHQPIPTLNHLFDELEKVILKMVELLMTVAPIGVFALMARNVAQLGLDILLPLIYYFLAVVIALAFHVLITYPIMLKSLTPLSPYPLFLKLRNMLTIAFASSSSAATLPMTLRTTDELGISRRVSGFSIPLGATINMDGTAIMQGVATVFIANAYQVVLTFNDFLLIILTATFASIGTAAVPGAGLIMLTMVLVQVGLPVEGIALILGIDRLLDMMRTCVNVTGDVFVSTIVAHKTQLLNHTVYEKQTE